MTTTQTSETFPMTQTITHGQKVYTMLRGSQCYGTVGVSLVYSPPKTDEDRERVQRNHLRGDDEAWVNQDAHAIVADPSYYDRRDAERVGAIGIIDGETYNVDHGEAGTYLMKAKVNGDYSDMVSFTYVADRPALYVEAQAAHAAGTLKPQGPPCYY